MMCKGTPFRKNASSRDQRGGIDCAQSEEGKKKGASRHEGGVEFPCGYVGKFAAESNKQKQRSRRKREKDVVPKDTKKCTWN